MKKALAVLQIIFLMSSQVYGAPQGAPSASPTPADVTDYKDTCKHVKNKEEMLKTYTSDSCLAKDKCKADAMAIVSTNFGQIGPLCKASELAGKGKAMEAISVSVFGAAAALCLVECFTKVFKPEGLGDKVCQGASAGATALDLGMTIGLTVQKKKFHDWYKNKDGKTWAGMQWGGTIAGGAATGASFTKDLKKDLGPIKKDKADSCFAGVLLGAAAAIKGIAIGKAKKVEDGVKENIKKLGGDMLANLDKLDQRYNPQVTSGGFNGMGSLPNTQTPGVPNSSENPLAGVGNDIFDSNNPQVHAALANTPGMEDFLKRLGPNGATKKALDELGFNPEKFASKVATGMSPSAAMGEMMPSIPKEALKAISELEDYAKKGEMAMNGVSGTYTASKATPSKTGGHEIKELNFDDEKTEEGSEELVSTLDFDGGRVPAAVDPSDIWHASYQGTIFDIVSQRISKAKTGEEE